MNQIPHEDHFIQRERERVPPAPHHPCFASNLFITIMSWNNIPRLSNTSKKTENFHEMTDAMQVSRQSTDIGASKCRHEALLWGFLRKKRCYSIWFSSWITLSQLSRPTLTQSRTNERPFSTTVVSGKCSDWPLNTTEKCFNLEQMHIQLSTFLYGANSPP